MRDPANYLAERATIQHAIVAAGLELQIADDMFAVADDHERVVYLAEAVGEVSNNVLRNGCINLDDRLLRAGALIQVWLEQRSRERAL